jgi:hypothetical protein
VPGCNGFGLALYPVGPYYEPDAHDGGEQLPGLVRRVGMDLCVFLCVKSAVDCEERHGVQRTLSSLANLPVARISSILQAIFTPTPGRSLACAPLEMAPRCAPITLAALRYALALNRFRAVVASY